MLSNFIVKMLVFINVCKFVGVVWVVWLLFWKLQFDRFFIGISQSVCRVSQVVVCVCVGLLYFCSKRGLDGECGGVLLLWQLGFGCGGSRCWVFFCFIGLQRVQKEEERRIFLGSCVILVVVFYIGRRGYRGRKGRMMWRYLWGKEGKRVKVWDSWEERWIEK